MTTAELSSKSKHTSKHTGSTRLAKRLVTENFDVLENDYKEQPCG